MSNLQKVIKTAAKITDLCNELEKNMLVESVKNKGLLQVKNQIVELKELIIQVLQGVINSDIINFEVAILFENGIYLGVIKSKYVVYSKVKNKDDIKIIKSSDNLQKALEYFYYYAYKNKIKKSKIV